MKAIDFAENKQYIKYALVPVSILLLLFFSGNKNIVTKSARIISHNTYFETKAPFFFILENNHLQAVKGKDFTLKMHFEGEEIPTVAFVVVEGNKYRLKRMGVV